MTHCYLILLLNYQFIVVITVIVILIIISFYMYNLNLFYFLLYLRNIILFQHLNGLEFYKLQPKILFLGVLHITIH